MKKFLLYAINLFLLFLILIFLEYYCYSGMYDKNEDLLLYNHKIKKACSLKEKIHFYVQNVFPPHDYSFSNYVQKIYENLRPVEYRNKSKNPVIIFGCSFAFGHNLNQNETFSYKLANYTDRTVYNRAYGGQGIPFFYYQLNDEALMKTFPSNSEYIIYVFIRDHINRNLRLFSWEMYNLKLINYKLKNNKLKLVNNNNIFSYLNYFYLVKYIKSIIYGFEIKNRDKKEKLFFKYIEESDKIIKEKFPQAKFVILYMYDPVDTNFDDSFDFNYLYEVVKNINPNIILLNSTKLCPSLTSVNYWLKDGHPNAKAWDLLVPEISKKLEM